MESKFDNTVELETAQEWAKRWRKQTGEYDRHHEVKAFLIPLQDLQDVIDSGAENVRAYLGADEDGTPKLMMVGTKWDKEHQSHNDMLPGTGLDGKVYDFTRPCPPGCGYNSPLDNIPPKE